MFSDRLSFSRVRIKCLLEYFVVGLRSWYTTMDGRVARTNLLRSHGSGKTFELLSHVRSSENSPPSLYHGIAPWGFIYFKLVGRFLRTGRVYVYVRWFLLASVRSGGAMGQHVGTRAVRTNRVLSAQRVPVH